MKHINIAIDGPSGAGKSTISKEIAKRLGIPYIDTGAIYRAIGLHTFRQGKDPTKGEDVIPLLKEIQVHLQHTEEGQQIFLNGENVSTAIRIHEISKYASDVSAIPDVRAFLLDLQRDMAKKQTVIMDGRDIGTVVLPCAEVKIFLTAKPEIRAKRRLDELLEKGQQAVFEKILEDINIRDFNDSNRAVAPLKPAEDSITVDNGDMTFEESVQTILKIIEERR